MTADPNANASAASVSDKLDGLVNGQPLDYELVALLEPSEPFGLATTYPHPEGPNTTSSMMDKITTLAKVLTRTYKASDGKTYDLFDMLALLTEARIKAGD